MQPAPIPILQARGLAKSFGGVRAVAGVDLTLGRGEILALIGPNGAGKTTCFNMLDGQLAPDSGEVRLNGRDILGLPPQRLCRLGVARTFQITRIFASMSVRENVQVALLARERRLFRSWRPAASSFRAEAEQLLARVGIGAQADRPCAILAYGDLKRVDLAIALAGEPTVILMDEPTAGMAPPERGALMSLIAGLARSTGLSVLFTEHDTDVVFAHADRVIVLDRGRILAEGSPAAVRSDPRVQETYLGLPMASS